MLFFGISPFGSRVESLEKLAEVMAEYGTLVIETSSAFASAPEALIAWPEDAMYQETSIETCDLLLQILGMPMGGVCTLDMLTVTITVPGLNSLIRNFQWVQLKEPNRFDCDLLLCGLRKASSWAGGSDLSSAVKLLPTHSPW